MHSFSIRSRIAHFSDTAPSRHDYGFTYIEDGIIFVENGKIIDSGKAGEFQRNGLDLAGCEHLPEHLILSGFIDAHVHAPQVNIIGSYGEQLLDWLKLYTFPAEIKFSKEEYSHIQTEKFIDALLANGTTSAMVFTTTFKHSTEQLFKNAYDLDMRLITGKVLMDRNAPKALLENPDTGTQDCHELIKNWHNKGRLGYAITPRFSGTSTPRQLAQAGELLREYPDLWVQTHLSENKHEIAWTKKLFPDAKDYLDTYEQFGLHTNKTIFAHCLHLNESESSRIQSTGSSVAFCPSSNLFLGSGLFDMAHFKERGIPVAICSDVGAGTSLSPFRTLGDAYKVCQLLGYSLNAKEAYFNASKGAAKALGIDQFVGNLDSGKEADFIVINPKNMKSVHERTSTNNAIEDELFVYMTCGDERLIDRTYIAGNLVYEQCQEVS